MEYQILNESEAIERVFDKDLLKELLTDFSQMKELDWDVFDNHLKNGNMNELEHISHSIKGVSGNLSLIGIYKTSTNLNNAVRQNNLTAAAEYFEDLKKEVARFRDFLPEYLNS